ncbi:fibronectin type III domain-containing protein [Nocardioides solisilvae]|uniref:fibronectin type III domain-containing protein n=1 Tax=Nocardioides solisilvae TaxID=1542435 RepID=UPI000D7435A8|nr:fibronectin type III domain-containing protein [Nocardioides solisilvae]
MLSRFRTIGLVLSTALALASSPMALVPAEASTNVIVSGVVTDSAGNPAPGVRVTPIHNHSSVTTDSAGAFAFPVVAGTSTSLSITTPYGAAGYLALETAYFTANESRSLGALPLPPMASPETVRVLDEQGTPVYWASTNGSIALTQETWADHGWELGQLGPVARASFLHSARTEATGELTVAPPRLLGGPLPAIDVGVHAPGVGEFSANLRDASAGAPRELTIGGFTVGPPTTPVFRFVNASDGQADVSWEPVSPAGSPVTGYTVVSHPGGHRGVLLLGSSDYARVSGLTNGVTYTFTVTAHSPAGDSTSVTSAAVTPLGRPGITSISHTAGTDALTFTWEVADGGVPLTEQRVYVDGRGWTTVPIDQRSLTVPSLRPATAYEFGVMVKTRLGDAERYHLARTAAGTPTVPGTGTPTPTATPTAEPSTAPTPVDALTPEPTPTPTAAPAPVVTGKPRVSGRIVVGSTVRVALPLRTPGAKATYRWFADGKAIRSARKPKLALTRSLRGRKLTVRIRATAPGHAPWQRTLRIGRVR